MVSANTTANARFVIGGEENKADHFAYSRMALAARRNSLKYCPFSRVRISGILLSRLILEGRFIPGTTIRVPRFVISLAAKKGLSVEQVVGSYLEWLKKIDEAAEEALRPPTKLSEQDHAAFKAFATDEKNQWVPRKKSPAAFISEKFAPWLGRGLRRSDLTDIVPKLASAYATEISRHRERQVVALLEAPRQLPAGTPLSSTKRTGSRRLTAELSPEELERQQAKKRAAGQAYRDRQRDRRDRITADRLTIKPS